MECVCICVLFRFRHNLQVDVVEAAYTLLRSKLVTVRDFVSLQRAHQEFLATLRAKFYVDNLEIAQVPLIGLFQACVFDAQGGKGAKPGPTVHKRQ